jgi:type VI secretion system secreted protein VgrG
MQIYDSVSDMPVLPGGGELLYQPMTGAARPIESVFALRQTGALKTDYVRLKDYNYRTPEAILKAESKSTTQIKGKGVDYRHGENYKTLDEGERIARIRQEAIDWQRETFVAETDCRGLAPGLKFTLVGHPVSELNGDYLVLEVEHHGDQRAGQGYGEINRGKTYSNRVFLVRAGVPYRSSIIESPIAHGIFTAIVETTGGEYAYLDDQGRYHIRMPFDLSDQQTGEASHPVRMAQPYTGNKYGIHFPLHAGTEVAVVCTNGDLDRPVILGAVSNPDTPNTVTAANHSQNVLRTWGGNELCMEDRKGFEKTELFTRDRKNILTLGANQEGHVVRLATEEGEMEQYAKKTMLVESGDSQTVECGNNREELIKNSQQLMTKNEHIESHAATDTRLEAGQHILMQAEREDFKMEVAKDLVFDVQGNTSIEVRNNNLEMQVTNGDTSIQAAKAITFKGDGGGMIHVGQNGGVIEVSTGGDLTVDGKTINVSAPIINIRGNSVGNN